LHKALQITKEEFKRVVRKELTGKKAAPSELVYFKVYKSQLLRVEQETLSKPMLNEHR
jgi:hypothetical protein